MKKSMVTALGVLLALGTAGAQQKQIYNNGQVDFAPSAARFVLTANEMEANVAEIQYSVNGGESQVYNGPVRISEEGRHVISYRAIDVTGNISTEEAYTVIIDDTAPGLFATAKGQAFVEDGAAYLRGDTAILLNANDSASGLNGIFVSLDNENFVRYDDMVSITEEGEHRGYAYAVDNVGNRSRTYSMRAFVDNTPPEVRIVPRRRLTTVEGERYTAGGNEFMVRASDEVSGLEQILVSIDRQEFVPYSGPISFSEAGFHSIRAQAIDRLGNTSSIVELTFSVDVDVPQPRLDVIIDE